MQTWAHKKTDDPTLTAILLTRQINTLCGAPVVTPWTVYDLDDEWLDTFSEVMERLGGEL